MNIQEVTAQRNRVIRLQPLQAVMVIQHLLTYDAAAFPNADAGIDGGKIAVFESRHIVPEHINQKRDLQVRFHLAAA